MNVKPRASSPSFHFEVMPGPDISAEEEIETLKSLVNLLNIQLENCYHKLRIGKRLKFRIGPPIFPDTP